MSPDMGTRSSGRGLWALDPDLPFLASEAAIDVENIIAGGRRDLKAIRSLAERVANLNTELSDDKQSSEYIDPATIAVLGVALKELPGNQMSATTRDLLTDALEIANSMSEDRINTGEKKNLERVRDFCVALSKAAFAYHRSLEDLRPSHPFRK